MRDTFSRASPDRTETIRLAAAYAALGLLLAVNAVFCLGLFTSPTQAARRPALVGPADGAALLDAAHARIDSVIEGLLSGNESALGRIDGLITETERLGKAIRDNESRLARTEAAREDNRREFLRLMDDLRTGSNRALKHAGRYRLLDRTNRKVMGQAEEMRREYGPRPTPLPAGARRRIPFDGAALRDGLLRLRVLLQLENMHLTASRAVFLARASLRESAPAAGDDTRQPGPPMGHNTSSGGIP
ncbi:hypothetical protein DND132_2477 [Pseudodesulfovibrio mercurii]|uniref:Uncharacterized protein n=1 Tax=Pseudodesulfovibrio mercurii TaxID=641491 RepID=F0JCK0_9BACT|nr:hypothetical protein [Pseudodesulfovibrio mercurii]EGB15680.1 hypothetical protein DND132_2477 [Pseudodesulfovibrio mercurii]